MEDSEGSSIIEHSKLSKFSMLRRGTVITIGALLVAFGLEEFLVPNNLIDGGVTGFSIIAAHLCSIPLGYFLFFLNLPFLFLGYKQIGKTFAISTLYGVSVMSVGTLFLHNVPPVTSDPLLTSVFGGICLGAGVGLVIRAGGSLDGTEIIAILVNKNSPFSLGEIVMICNLFILGSAGFVFGWDRAMYSLITYYIAFKVIDITIEGFQQSKSVWIISEKHKEIGDTLTRRLGRGITYLNGEGGFTGEVKHVIFCIITRLEEAKMKSIVDEVDPSAFLAIADIHDVKGGRFKKKAIH